MTIITTILSWLSGPIVKALVDAYKTKLENKTKQDVLAVDLAVAEIQAESAARREATKLLIAEQGRWYTAMIRPLFALPFVLYVWKVVVYDKLWMSGTTATDAILGPVGDWAGIIIASYFGSIAIDRIAKVFKR